MCCTTATGRRRCRSPRRRRQESPMRKAPPAPDTPSPSCSRWPGHLDRKIATACAAAGGRAVLRLLRARPVRRGAAVRKVDAEQRAEAGRSATTRLAATPATGPARQSPRQQRWPAGRSETAEARPVERRQADQVDGLRADGDRRRRRPPGWMEFEDRPRSARKVARAASQAARGRPGPVDSHAEWCASRSTAVCETGRRCRRASPFRRGGRRRRPHPDPDQTGSLAPRHVWRPPSAPRPFAG